MSESLELRSCQVLLAIALMCSLALGRPKPESAAPNSTAEAARQTKSSEPNRKDKKGRSENGKGVLYDITQPPGPTWFPFADAGSVTNKPLPTDVLQHCWGDTSDCSAGDTVAKWTLSSGYGATDFSRHGMTVGYVYFPNTLPNGNSADISGATYYGQATDPWYRIDGCHYSKIDVRFHAPNRAKFGALPGGDQGIDIYDVAQGLLIQAYGYNSNPGMVMPDASSCPGAGPSSCAVVIPNLSGCSAQQVSVDTDLQGHGYRRTKIGKNTYTLGGTGATGIFSGWAGMLRQNELMNGTVNHSLLLGVVCAKPGRSAGQSSFVWPAQSGLLRCTNDNPGEPPAGALLFCDYTPAQISSMLNAGQISQPQATLLRTFCTYGGYVAQTGGPASGSSWQGMRLAASQAYEGQTAYQLYHNYDNGFLSWACAHGMNDFGQPGCKNGVIVRPYGPSLDVLGGIPLMTGPRGKDTSGRSCSVAPGCDVSGHIHVADPCVVRALAGLGGGCQ